MPNSAFSRGHSNERGRPDGITRERIGEAVVERGLTGVTPTLKLVLAQILQGR